MYIFTLVNYLWVSEETGDGGRGLHHHPVVQGHRDAEPAGPVLRVELCQGPTI